LKSEQSIQKAGCRGLVNTQWVYTHRIIHSTLLHSGWYNSSSSSFGKAVFGKSRGKGKYIGQGVAHTVSAYRPDQSIPAGWKGGNGFNGFKSGSGKGNCKGMSDPWPKGWELSPSSSTQAEQEHLVVGASAGSTTGFIPYPTGSASTRSVASVANANSKPLSYGARILPGHPSGVSKSRCSKGTFSFGKSKSALPSPLVHHNKARRGGGLKHRLISDCRLIAQSASETTKVQAGSLQRNISSSKKKYVGLQSRSCTCILPLIIVRKTEKYMKIQVGSRMFPFVAAPFGLGKLPQQCMAVMKVFLKL